MPDPEHGAVLEQGVDVWNAWRKTYPDLIPDLSGIKLSRRDLAGIDFDRVDLTDVVLEEVNLHSAHLRFVKLGSADLFTVDLRGADLSFASLRWAVMREVTLDRADLLGAELRDLRVLHSTFRHARLAGADLSDTFAKACDFREADFCEAMLRDAHFSSSDFSGATLDEAFLIRTDLRGALLNGCSIHNTVFREVDDEAMAQEGLRITAADLPQVLVDDVALALFLQVTLEHERVRHLVGSVPLAVILMEKRGEMLNRGKIVHPEIQESHVVTVLLETEHPPSPEGRRIVETLINLSQSLVVDPALLSPPWPDLFHYPHGRVIRLSSEEK